MRRTLLMTVALVAAAISADPAMALCRDDRAELRGDWGTARFRVAVADDAAERAQGLMHVEEMPRMAGMLFVYDQPGSVAFWMENTLIPLDMLFITEDGLVRRVHSNAIPLDRTSIPGGSPDIRYVLEINGGVAEDFGITEGSQLRHPAIPQDTALWPCDE